MGEAVLMVALITSFSKAFSGAGSCCSEFTFNLYSIDFITAFTTRLLICNKYLLPGSKGLLPIQQSNTSSSFSTEGLLPVCTITSPLLTSISSCKCSTTLCGAKASSTSLPATSITLIVLVNPEGCTVMASPFL